MKKILYILTLVAAVSLLFSSTPVDAAQIFTGDGTYTFSNGDKVKLNNGLIIEPVVTMYSGQNPSGATFKVYDSSQVWIGTTKDVNAGWPEEIFGYNGQIFGAKVFEYSNGTFSPKVALTSYEQPAYVKLISPNGGEMLQSGDTVTIQWEQRGIKSVYIYYYNADFPSTLSTIVSNLSVDPNSNYASYKWVIPDKGKSLSNLKIKINSYAAVYDNKNWYMDDTSDGTFEIFSNKIEGSNPAITTPPSAVITSPSSSANLKIGDSYTISWQSITNDKYSFVDLFLDMGEQTDNKNRLIPITPFVYTKGSLKLNNVLNFNTGSYLWKIPSSVDLSVVNFGSIAYSYSLSLDPNTNNITVTGQDAQLINGQYTLPPPVKINAGKHRIYAMFSDGGNKVNHVFSDYFSIGNSTVVQNDTANTPYSLDSYPYTGDKPNALNLRVNWLIKNKEFAEVFWVDSDLCLHWIINEEIAERNFGVTWNYEGTIREFDTVSEWGYKFCEKLE